MSQVVMCHSRKEMLSKIEEVEEIPTPQQTNGTIHSYHESIQKVDELVEKDISMPSPEFKVEANSLLSLDSVDASVVQNRLA